MPHNIRDTERIGLRDLFEHLVQYDILLREEIPEETRFFINGERIKILPERIKGFIDYENMIIQINPRQTIRERINTLFHEILHSYYDSNKIKRTEREIESEAIDLTNRIYNSSRLQI